MAQPDSNPPERSALDSANVLAQLVEDVRDYAIYALDAQGNVASWNSGAESMTGYTAPAVLGRHISLFYTPDAIAAGHPQRQLDRATALGRYEEESWRVRRDGTRYWASVLITALFDRDGRLVGFGEVTRDLTERKQAEEERSAVVQLLQETVRSDPLTGLANRRALDETLTREIAAARRNRMPLSIAMIDVDRFKAYNDGNGHQAGDRLLKHAAGAWFSALRASDTLARFGGEEFVAVLPDCTLDDAFGVIDRMRGVTPFGQTCSAGVAEWDGEETVDQLIRRADDALYAAKHAGRNAVVRAPSP